MKDLPPPQKPYLIFDLIYAYPNSSIKPLTDDSLCSHMAGVILLSCTAGRLPARLSCAACIRAPLTSVALRNGVIVLQPGGLEGG